MASYLINPLSGKTFSRMSAPNLTVVSPGWAAEVPTALGAATIFAPPNPVDRTCFAVIDANGVIATNPITVNANGQFFDGGDATVVLSGSGGSRFEAVFVYDADLSEWTRVVPQRTFSDEQPAPLQRFVDLPPATVPLDVNLSGTYAALPAAGTAGRVYSCTDRPYLYYDTGTVWLARESQMLTTPLPAAAAMTQYLAGGRATTFEDYAHGWRASDSNGALNDGRYFMKAIATPGNPLTVIARARMTGPLANYNGWGLALRDTVSGRVQMIEVHQGNGAVGFAIANMTASDATQAPATYNLTANPFTFNYGTKASNDPVWFKVEDAGGAGNLSWYFSADGTNWHLAYTIARTNFLANGPGEYGIGLLNSVGGTSTNASVVVDSFQVTE